MVTKALPAATASSSNTNSAPNKLVNEKVDEAIAAGVAAANSNFKIELDKWHQNQAATPPASSSSTASLSDWEEDLDEWSIKLKAWVDTATAEARAKVKTLPDKSQRAMAGGLLLIALSALEDLVHGLMRGLRAALDKTLDAAANLWRRLCSVCSVLEEAVVFATLALWRQASGSGSVRVDATVLLPLLAEQV